MSLDQNPVRTGWGAEGLAVWPATLTLNCLPPVELWKISPGMNIAQSDWLVRVALSAKFRLRHRAAPLSTSL